MRELYPAAARRLRIRCSERVFELSELLVRRLGVDDVGASFPHRVTYHPTCHSLRVTRVGDAPLRLLRNVRGLELVELPRAEECCGFGGTFSVKNADTSSAMLADKCARVEATRRRGLHRASTARACCRSAAGSRAGERGVRADPPRRDPRRRRDGPTSFPAAARRELANAQLRANLRNATDTIRDKRARVVARGARLGGAARGRARDQGGRARAPRRATSSEFEAAVEAAGGHVHWARDAAEANAIVAGVARAHGATEVVKVKSLTTDEIELNDALGARRASTRSRPTSRS